MKQTLEQEVAEPGKVYDCKIISQYGHETLTRGIYLGKIMGAKKQLHGFVFMENKGAKFVSLIKFSTISMHKNQLEIRSPTRVYNLNEKQEEEYKSLLEKKL